MLVVYRAYVRDRGLSSWPRPMTMGRSRSGLPGPRGRGCEPPVTAVAQAPGWPLEHARVDRGIDGRALLGAVVGDGDRRHAVARSGVDVEGGDAVGGAPL